MNPRFHALIVAALLIARCSSASSQVTDQNGQNALGERISHYWRGQFCTTAECKNPVLIVFAEWIKLVRFDGKYQEEYVRLAKLQDYLESIPPAAWPKGPKLWVRESDFDIVKPGESLEVTEAAKRRQMALVLRVCDSLGLTLTRKDGTPFELK